MLSNYLEVVGEQLQNPEPVGHPPEQPPMGIEPVLRGRGRSSPLAASRPRVMLPLPLLDNTN